MTATDLLPRLAAIGAHLARSAPALVVALLAFLEAIARALDAATSARPSDTVSAPSMMERASASRRLRE